jgi:hypothetical protein
MRSVQQRVVSRLEQAYHSRVALYLHVTLCAPVLVVPHSLSDPRSRVLVVEPGQLRLRTKALRLKQAVLQQLLTAAATPVVAPTPPAFKGKTNLCYTWAAHAFNLAGATACVKTNCPNKHTPFVSGSVDKDAVKAELEGIQAPEFKRKLFAAVDAF